MTLEEIQQAIAKLPPEDVAKLRLWLAQVATESDERAAEPESTAEKFGRFAGRAFADLRRRAREK
jgi:hypothetical protein